MGVWADGPGSFLSSLPTLHSPLAPPGQLQLKAKLKAARVVQRWFPGLSSPPPHHHNWEDRDGRSEVTPSP